MRSINGYPIEKPFGKCVICDELRHIFLKGQQVCASCAFVVPSYIPDEQVMRYLEAKIEI